MSKVVSKASVFSSTIFHHHDDHNNCRNFPMKFSVSVGKRGKLVGFSSLKSSFGGVRTVVDQNGSLWSHKKRNPQSIHAKLGLSIGKSQRWWEKELQPNMKEITSAEDLVDSLLRAGDQLVVVDFYSPGCGGCRALHPKICQLAVMNPDVQFLQINYEEHRSMCYSLNVHVLPFFRFYRGADGRVCSFSCTNATIKKFKDALAKYNTVRSNLGPTKGLEEKELLALSANKDLSFTYTPKPDKAPTEQEVSIATDTKIGAEESHVPSDRTLLNSPLTANSSQDNEEKTLVTARR